MSNTRDHLAVYWVWLNELRGLPLAAKRKLLQILGDPDKIFHATFNTVIGMLSNTYRPPCQSSRVAERASIAERTSDTEQTSDTERGMVEKLEAVWSGRNLKCAESIMKNNSDHGIRILCADDPQYRDIFMADPQAPLVLYYRGKLAPRGVPVVGVIGSRACTSYGRMVTRVVVEELVGKGQVVASGLSFGIDALAHETTLAHQGITYAFLPCGLHKAQPAAHAALMERIADTGAVITPYAYGKDALPFRFNGRNAVLATWCDTLIVIEARIKSGTMHTAKIALAKGNRVLAVPNSLLEPRSGCTNQLLADGAHAYLNDRLMHELELHPLHPSTPLGVQRGEAAITKVLREKAMTASEIVTAVRDDGVPVMECLVEMELTDKLEFRSDGKWHLSGGL